MFFKKIIRVIKATFPSSPKERNFIKDLKWPKLITDFLKTFEYTYSNNNEHKIQNVSGKASLVYHILTVISSTTFAILATHNRHYQTSTDFFCAHFKQLYGSIMIQVLRSYW